MEDFRLQLPDLDKPRTWAEHMALEQTGPNTFCSLVGATFGGSYVKVNGEKRPRAYGGHFYAQAAFAASKTVPSGFHIHGVTGFFLILGLADEPFKYIVKTVRNGKSYCIRQVTVVQSDVTKAIFTSTVSFKKTEYESLDIQTKQNLGAKYNGLLNVQDVSELSIISKETSLLEAAAHQEPCVTNLFPGMMTTILPLEAFHKHVNPLARRNLYVYTALQDTDESDPNLDACAHIYHSDRESNWAIIRQYNLFDKLTFAASLMHTVVFHAGPARMNFRENGQKKWYYQETWSNRIGDGRMLHQGCLYDAQGNHLLSTMQDGAVKFGWDSKQDMLQRQEKILKASKL